VYRNPYQLSTDNASHLHVWVGTASRSDRLAFAFVGPGEEVGAAVADEGEAVGVGFAFEVAQPGLVAGGAEAGAESAFGVLVVGADEVGAAFAVAGAGGEPVGVGGVLEDVADGVLEAAGCARGEVDELREALFDGSPLVADGGVAVGAGGAFGAGGVGR
jgi:hypothetical protein